MTDCIIVSGFGLCVVGTIVGVVSTAWLVYFVNRVGGCITTPGELLGIIAACAGVSLGLFAFITMCNKYILSLLPCITVV